MVKTIHTQPTIYIDKLSKNIPTESKSYHAWTRVTRLAQQWLSSSDKAMSDHSPRQVATHP